MVQITIIDHVQLVGQVNGPDVELLPVGRRKPRHGPQKEDGSDPRHDSVDDHHIAGSGYHPRTYYHAFGKALRPSFIPEEGQVVTWVRDQGLGQ